MTTSLCIGEMLSCALLGAAAKAATDPTAKAVLTRMTRMTADESIHGQSGFHFLTSLLPAVTKRRRRWLEKRATEAAFSICLAPYDDVTHPFGALPYSKLEPVMRATWKRSIAPGFAKLGLSVREHPFVS